MKQANKVYVQVYMIHIKASVDFVRGCEKGIRETLKQFSQT